MRNFRNNFRRSRYKNHSDRNNRRNENGKIMNDLQNGSNFIRKNSSRNNHNAPKLIEKYNDLAREASSNGDKILSENYLQHADHFTRILNEQEKYKKLKFAENKAIETATESEELADKSKQINIEEKKILAEIETISKKETEAN